ncbi:MAG: chlorite dismutase family protein [Bacteroidetes bacterium]|nr:MAG: chlorite dismutase family protein [Bacteroidota bacterium]
MLYHNYIFLSSKKTIFDIPENHITDFQKKFIQEIEKEKRVIVHTYTTVGLKANTSLLLWFQSDELQTIQNLLNNLLHTQLGKHIEITHTLFGMTRLTQYSSRSVTHLHTNRKGGKYLIIYPFTKTKEWHMLPFEKRKELMIGHMKIGGNYPQIQQLLVYSYGIDDNEFIVSYETDALTDFQQLVMDLRSDPVRAFTLNDTPVFTCVYRPVSEALHFL